MTLLRTTAAAVLTALAALALSAAPALAHAGLTGSSPADGATLDAVPAEVALEFSEEVRAPAFAVITGPDGRSHEAGEPDVEGATVTQQVDAARVEGIDPNGTWTIAYRVVSADGHPIQGQTTFTVEGAPAPGTAASDAATPDAQPTAIPSSEAEPTEAVASDNAESDSSPAPFIVALSAGLLVVVVAVQQSRKRQTKEKAKP